MERAKLLTPLPGGLRGRFLVAVACMAVVPFLVCLYLVSVFVFPVLESLWLTSSIILLTMLISYGGFHLMGDVVRAVVTLSREARLLVPHRACGTGAAGGEDEIDSLRMSLAALAREVDRATRALKELETRDDKIGVYTERYLRDVIVDELRRADLHKRPCSLLLARFRGGPRVDAILGDERYNFMALAALARVMKRFATGLEKVGRIGTSGICLVLPECPREEAQNLAARIKIETETIFWDGLSAMADWNPELVLTVSSAPFDGVDPTELLHKCIAADGVR